MAGKTGIIGRVAVKVTPDLDGFYEKTKAELEAIGKRLPDVKVKFELEGVDRAVDKAKARLASITDVEVNVDIELDQADLERVQDKLDDLDGKAHVEVEIASGSYRAAQATLAWLSRRRVVTFMPEVSKVGAAKVLATLSALSGLRVLDSTFDRFTDWLKNLDKSAPIIGSLVAAMMGLAGWLGAAASNAFALARDLALIAPAALALPGILGGLVIGIGATIAVFKDFNEVLPWVKDALSDLQDRMSETFWKEAKAPIEDMIKNLLPQFEAGLIRTSESLAVFFGGLAEALDGVLDGALEGMFNDLNESIEIAATGVEAFANIIKILGEAGASYLPRLAKWFVEISESFSDWLTEVQADGRLHEWIDQGIQMMKDLGRVISEASGILAGLGRAAAEAGGAGLSQLADTLESIHETIDSPAFQDGFINFLRNSHEMMSTIATTSGSSMVRMFESLGNLSTTVFPIVGRGLGLMAKAFAQVLDNPKFQTGLVNMMSGFEQFVAHLSGAVPKLSAGFGAILTIIGDLATNAGMVLVPAMEAFSDIVVTLQPGISNLIGALGSGLTTIIRDLAPIFTNAAVQLAPLVDGFADFVRETTPLVSSILTPLVQGFTDLAVTGIMMLVEAMAPLMPLLLEAAEVLGGALLEAAWLLLPPLVDLAAVLMESFLEAIIQISPYLPQIADGFVRIIEAVIPLIDPVSNLGNNLIPLLVEVFELIVGKIETLVPAFESLITGFSTLVEGVTNFMPVISAFFSFFTEILANILNGIGNFIEGVGDVLIGTWETIAGIFTGDWERAWEGIKQIGEGIWELIVGAFETFLNLGIWGAIKKILLGTVVKAWKTGWNTIKTAGSTIWNWLKTTWNTTINAIKTTASNVMNTIKSTWNEKWTAIKNWATTTWNSIKSTVTEKINSVKSTISSKMSEIKTNITTKWTEIKTTIQNKWNEITSWIKTKWDAFVLDVQGFWAKVKDKFKKGMDDAKTQVENGFNTLKTWFTELPGKIKGWLGDLGTTLLQAGKDLIQGFIDGIGSMFSSVKSKLGSLTSSLTSWKGPPKKDKKLLTPAGHMVIQGFIDGLEDRFDDVRKLLRDLTEEIEGTSIMAPTVEPFEIEKKNNKAIRSALPENGEGVGYGKTFIYNAAPNNSLEAQEELFEAMNRGRAVGW